MRRWNGRIRKLGQADAITLFDLGIEPRSSIRVRRHRVRGLRACFSLPRRRRRCRRHRACLNRRCRRRRCGRRTHRLRRRIINGPWGRRCVCRANGRSWRVARSTLRRGCRLTVHFIVACRAPTKWLLCRHRGLGVDRVADPSRPSRYRAVGL